MILKRISKFFSSNRKNTTKKDIAVGAGIASTSGFIALSNARKMNKSAINKHNSTIITAKDSNKVGDKLLIRAHNNGIPLYLNTKGENYYGRGKTKSGKSIELINLDAKNLNAATIAHEVGHSEHYKGRSGGKVGKLAHNIDATLSKPLKGKAVRDRLTKSLKGNTAFAGVGFANGLNAERKKQRGEERNIYNKIGSAAIPLALISPRIMKEAAASKKGLKMMKELGASKELIDQSKKKLGRALNTYTTSSSAPVVSSVLGDVSGRVYGKLTKEKKKKEEKD